MLNTIQYSKRWNYFRLFIFFWPNAIGKSDTLGRPSSTKGLLLARTCFGQPTQAHNGFKHAPGLTEEPTAPNGYRHFLYDDFVMIIIIANWFE